jgi:hypothetical protein
LEIEMNVKQLFAIMTLLAASGAAMAQAPAPTANKPAAAAKTSGSADSKANVAQEASQPAAGKSKSSKHDHKDDGPKKSIYSGA